MSNEVTPASDFATIIRNSLHRESIARMVCTSCRQSNHLRIKRVFPDIPLPPVLIVNAGVRTSDELDFWIDRDQPFLKPKFSINTANDSLVVMSPANVDHTVYELSVRLLFPLSCRFSLLTSFISHRQWSSRFKRMGIHLIWSL